MFWCSDQNFNKGFPYFLTKKAKEKGVESFDVSLETQIVQVESSTLSREEVYEIIKKSGKATEMLPWGLIGFYANIIILLKNILVVLTSFLATLTNNVRTCSVDKVWII